MKHDKMMKHYRKLLSLGILMLMTGCTTPSHLKKPKLPQKPEFNAALQDENFQAVFKTRHIKLVAPASGTDPEKIESLQSLNDLKVDVPPNLMSKDIIFHANSDEERFHLLKNALYDRSKNTVIWSLRGGYGSARLLDKLKALPKPKREKTFIGFSDNTALHLFLAQQWQWKTIHGSGLAAILSAEQDPKNFQKIGEILSKEVSEIHISHLKPLNTEAKNLKKISGLLTGGNLTTIQSGIKTHWQIKSAGKILFLEDTGEKGYRIDRTLYHLQQGGLLKNVKSIVFGDFTDSPDDVMVALERFAQNIHIPVFKTDQFGHGKINYPLVYNAKSEILPVEKEVSVTVIDGNNPEIGGERADESNKENQENQEQEFVLVMHLS